MPLVTTRANAANIGYLNGSRKLPYKWVMTDLNGDVYTSTSTSFANGSFTTHTTPFSGVKVPNDIASNGKNLYVVVGDTGGLMTSPDGATWTSRTSSFGSTNINAVAYGNDGYWVAVGLSGLVAYSTDGISWTQISTGISGSVTSVAWGNNLWIIGNGTGAMRTATTPTGTWTSRTSTLGNISDIHYYKAQSIWVAGNDSGMTGALASSTDGTTWTARSSSFNINAAGSSRFASSGSILVHQAYDGSLSAAISTSANGTTYTNRTSASTGLILWSNITSDDAGFFVANGPQVSSNGTSWSNRNGPGGTLNNICHSSGTPSIR